MTTQSQTFKAGFIAVCGKPNVGKSTLVNTILQQKVAAVSPRPQTTRKRQLGILTTDEAQVIFIDTPGLHKPRHKLGKAMNQEAVKTVQEADQVLFLVDGSLPFDEEDLMLADILLKIKQPVIVIINKVDLVNRGNLDEVTASCQRMVPGADILPVSSLQNINVDKLLTRIIQRLPEHPPFYPDDMLTDLYEREIAADLIREAALKLLRDEIPHGIAVRIDQYTERGESGAYIEATLFVERESHKGIVIGQGGSMLKQIGSAARQEIESMSGRKIFLQLRIKVRKNWRDDEHVIKSFGY